MFELISTAALLALGFVVGSRREKKHYLDIQKREQLFLHLPVRSDPGSPETASEAFLVMGSVVIGSDYFKTWISQLKSVFGGRLNALESLADRARREAVLRLKEKAHQAGATEVVNLRIQTSMLSDGAEVLAVGTALKR